jgi:rod shape-determining protein MreD
MQRFFITIGISLLVLLAQTTVVPHLAVGTIVPDLLLIWIVYLGISRGHMSAMTAGFFLGLVMDILAGDDGMLGLSSLTKTAAGFLAGYTFNENKVVQILSGYQFLVILGAASLVHDLLYFLIFLQGADPAWNEAIVHYGLPTTVYTLVAALIPLFVFARRYRT